MPRVFRQRAKRQTVLFRVIKFGTIAIRIKRIRHAIGDIHALQGKIPSTPAPSAPAPHPASANTPASNTAHSLFIICIMTPLFAWWSGDKPASIAVHPANIADKYADHAPLPYQTLNRPFTLYRGGGFVCNIALYQPIIIKP